MKEKSSANSSAENNSVENAEDLAVRIERAEKGLESVRSRIAEIGKDREITLLAATKTVPVEVINHLIDNCGLQDIGENRVQELLDKYDLLHLDNVKLHFIGSLQTNKVKYIIDKVCLIHSLDRLELAAEIDRQAAKHGLVMDVLVEINIGRESDKGGIMPEDALSFFEAISRFSHIKPCGIMTMAPFCAEKSDFYKYFEKTYSIFIDISDKKLHNIDRPILSMGMSDSFEAAIDCGSNLVRVGSAIFGSRSYPLK